MGPRYAIDYAPRPGKALWRYGSAPPGTMTPPRAIRTVTLDPAEATGLTDRALVAGRRGDLVRVAWFGNAPFARETYREGARIA